MGAADKGPASPPRRAVVTGIGAACLVALWPAAGCGRDTQAPAAPGPTPPAGLAPPTALEAGSAGSALGLAADVPVGGARIYPGLEVVVTQQRAGAFRGFSAVCTHDGCIVDKVVDGVIECPCHGSRYRLDGSVARGPARSPLTPRPVVVENGTIVLS